MGRNAQLIAALRQKGRTHLTKQEIKIRTENEIKLGENGLTCPEYIKADTVALEKWQELNGIFKDFSNVTNADAGIIARYCVLYSQFLELTEKRYRAEIDDLIKLDGLINKKADMLMKLEDRLFLNPLAKIKTIPIPKEEPKAKDPLEEAGFFNV